MVLVDYIIYAEFGNISFDRELTAEHLDIQHGDRYIASVTENGICLHKVKTNLVMESNQ